MSYCHDILLSKASAKKGYLRGGGGQCAGEATLAMSVHSAQL